MVNSELLLSKIFASSVEICLNPELFFFKIRKYINSLQIAVVP